MVKGIHRTTDCSASSTGSKHDDSVDWMVWHLSAFTGKKKIKENNMLSDYEKNEQSEARELERKKRQQQRAERRKCRPVDESSEDDQWRFKAGLCLPGEIAPMTDADNIADAATCARQFAHLLGLQVVIPGETLRQLESRVYEAWEKAGHPFIDIRTKKFDTTGRSKLFYTRKPFELTWICLPGSDEPLTAPAEVPVITENSVHT